MENYELSEEVKEWAAMSATEINTLKRKQCNKCYYFSKATGDKGSESTGTCDYIFLEKTKRPCTPLYCKEKGVFKQKDRKRTHRKSIVIRGKK